MAGDRIEYTLGVGVEIKNTADQVRILQDTLNKENFSIKMVTPDVNIGKADEIFERLKKEYKEVTEIAVDYKTVVDDTGKTIGKFADSISFKGVGAMGELRKHQEKLNEGMADFGKKMKVFNDYSLNADKAKASAKNLGDEQKKTVEGTAEKLQVAVQKWKEHAEKLNLNEKEAKELEAEIERLNEELQVNQAETKTSANAMQSFGLRLSNAIKQTGAYTVALRASRLAQQELRKAVSYSVELDTEMTKIKVLQVEGAKTEAQINGLAKSFNNLAKEMAISTLEVARGSTEWLRQGKTVAETQELLRSTVMLSKLGAIDTANATEKLTATLNAFNLEAKDAELIVDKLVAVDNIAATSVNELATAMQYSASIASQSGISFDQLTSYIAVISETTRQSAQTIGQAFKTIFSRMQMLREGKIDEDGIGINKVEDALYRVGILLRNEEGQFRNFGTVLEELGAIWQNWNGTMEQSNIAAALGGTRQVNLIYALLNNMNDALEFQEEQAKATGLATERYGIYLASVQAKIDTFKATLEGLYQSLISSDLIKWFIDFGQSILDSIEKAGGLQNIIKWALRIVVILKGVPAILKTIKALQVGTNLAKAALSMGSVAGQGMKVTGMLSGLLKGLKLTGASAEKTAVVQGLLNASYEGGNKGLAQYILTQMGVIPATNAATGATLGFGAAVWTALAPVLALTAAMVALFFIVKAYNKAKEASAKRLEHMAEHEENAKSIKKEVTSLKELNEERKKIKGELDTLIEGTTEYTNKQQELYDIRAKLSELYPEIVPAVNDSTTAFNNETTAIEALIKAKEDLARAEKKEAVEKAEKELFGDVFYEDSGFDRDFYDDQVEKGQINPNDFVVVHKKGRVQLISKDVVSGNLTGANSLYEAFQEKLLNPDDIDALNKYTEKLLGTYNALNLIEDVSKRMQLAQVFEDTFTAEDADDTAKKFWTEVGREFVNQARAFEVPDQSWMDDLDRGGASQEQKDSYLNKMDAKAKELYNVTLPKVINRLKELQEAFSITKSDELVPDELQVELKKLSVEVEHHSNKLYYLKDGNKEYIETEEQLVDIIRTEAIPGYNNLSIELKELVDNTLLATLNTKEQTDALRELVNETSFLSEAIDEQTKNQTVSLETAMRLKEIEAQLGEEYGNNYFQIEQLGDGYTFATDAVYEYANSQLMSEFNTIKNAAALAEGSAELNYIEQAALAASEGNLVAAMSFISMAEAANQSIPDIEKLKDILYQMANVWQKANSGGLGTSGGSAGAKKEDPRIKETEKLIKGLEKQIDAHKKEIDLHKKEIDIIKAAQKAYADWIDQKKKSLELAKNEADYYKDQEERLKSLAKLEKELAVIKLDNSPEARAKALELEEQIEEKRKEIEENSEERRHELQIRALEELKDAFDKASEEQIKGIQTIIDGIEEIIKGIQEQIKEQREFIQELREQDRSNGGDGRSPNRTGGTGESLLAAIQRTSSGKVGYGSNDEELGMPVSKTGDEPTQRSHLGGAIDINTNQSSGNVHSPQTGVVTYMGDTGTGYGKTIAIKNADGRIVTLSHLSEFGDLKVGQRVDKTDIIGKIDENWTGNGTGEHIHMATFQELNGEVVQTTTNFESFNRKLDYANSKFPAGILDFVTSLEDGRKTIVKVGGKVDKELTEQAEYISKATGLTSKELEGLADSVKSGAVNMEGGVSSMIKDLEFLGYDIKLTGEGLKKFYDFLKNISNDNVDVESKPKPLEPKPGGRKPGGQVEQYAFHSGGLVESHHDGDFAGGLNSNEVFAKLLKGEYVATESQMERFLSKTLPTLMGANLRIQPNAVNTEISLSMPINVEGNMDKSVIADIEVIANRAVEKINRQVASMGHIRTSNQFIS